MTDEVNHPEHYTSGAIECIDAIEAALTPEEFRGYCKGNALKYVWRERMKGGEQSIDKAAWYLARLSKPCPIAEATMPEVRETQPALDLEPYTLTIQGDAI